jgi:peptide/nickel transport system permease protein
MAGELTEELIAGGLRPQRSFRQNLVYRPIWFARNFPLGAFGAIFVILLLAMSIVPQAFTTLDPTTQVLADRLHGPSFDHWFGTDQLGRDLYTRIIYAARTSIMIGFGITVLGNGITTILGIASAYFGGWLDLLFQRLIDVVIALPGLLFIIIFVTSLRSRVGGDIPAIVISIGLLIAFGGGQRTIRGQTLSTKENQYIEAAHASGAGHVRIMTRHILPNVFAIVLVSMSLTVGGAVLVESSLSFLGYGVQPPTPSWGRMLSDARNYLVVGPHAAIFPGLLIFLTVYSFNMFGDALRDMLDPRLRGSTRA